MSYRVDGYYIWNDGKNYNFGNVGETDEVYKIVVSIPVISMDQFVRLRIKEIEKEGDMSKVIGVNWLATLPSGESIGVVIIKNDVGQHKAYIGIGSGQSEERDVNHIKNNGNPVDANVLRKIITGIEGGK